jgi:sarcosine oxidase
VALYERRAGLVAPEAAVAAHLGRATALGADLRFEEPVLAWEPAPSGDRVRVTTARGAHEAGQLVIAPGAWAPSLLAELRLPLVVERQVLYWFEPVGGSAPYAADRFPIYIWQLDDGLTFYGFPAQPGPPGGVKVSVFRFGPRPEPAGVPAATHAPDGAPWTPETLDRTVHAAEIERMRGCLVGRLPTLNGRFIEAVTCMYTTTPDEHFIIDRHPAHPNVVIASPCSGHGFKFASVIGEILAELATAGETRLAIDLFDLERFAR